MVTTLWKCTMLSYEAVHPYNNVVTHFIIQIYKEEKFSLWEVNKAKESLY